MDPITSYEQAEAEAVEQQDEARREQHWHEAEQAARAELDSWIDEGDSPLQAVEAVVLFVVNEADTDSDAVRLLRDFESDYGTPALLRVIATALEQK